MGQKIEGYWDCPYCRTKAIRGGIRICPNCGKARGEETKFYLIETDKFVSDDVVEKGPDWYCDYCDTLNPYSATHCINCNSARKDATDDYFSMREKKSKENNHSDEFSNTQSNNNGVDENFKASKVEAFMQKKTDTKDDNHEIIHQSKVSAIKEQVGDILVGTFEFLFQHSVPIIISFVVMALIGSLVYFLYPREAKINITDTKWTREIEIEEYKTVRENGWSIPSGGRLAYTQQEICTYKQVLDHYETVNEQKSERYISGYKTVTEHVDLGNGYFETRTHQEPEYSTRYYTVQTQKPVYKSEPVYKTKYYYDIDRWMYERTVTAEGENDPYWPEITNLDDNERTGTRTEKYSITGINDKNKEKTYKISYDLWEQIHVGDEIDVIVSGNTITEIKSIEVREG